jgi:hypothetical protein
MQKPPTPRANPSSSGSPRLVLDGRRDFDFLAGSWQVVNRKLRDPTPEAPTEWVEFEADVDSWLILGGLGNVDTYHFPNFPDRGPFHGFALRLFDPESRLWRIWWASSVGGGELDPPLSGRFTDGIGEFEGDDRFAGYPIKVRFEWSNITDTSARWQQWFSFDEGATFALNWVMEFSRRPSSAASASRRSAER